MQLEVPAQGPLEAELASRTSKLNYEPEGPRAGTS
jgi:hypothetical protein